VPSESAARAAPRGRLEADREVANTLADLIIGGLLVSGIDEHDGGTA
jgi:hypothetical protein